METPAAKTQNRRNVYLFGITSLCNDTASEMAYWILPAFLTALGAGPAAMGLIEGIAESVASLGKLFSGYLADIVPRRKPLVFTGYFIANIAKPFLALSTRWWHVLLIRFGDRTAKGIRGAPRDVMLSESVEHEKIGSAFGLLQSMDSAGAVVGPLFALLIMSVSAAHARSNDQAMRNVFWAAAIPGLLAIGIVLLVRETGTGRAGTSKAPEKFWSGFRRPGRLSARFYYMLVAVLIFSLGNSSDMFLVLRAQSVGIDAKLAPLLGIVFNVTYTLGSWPAGHISDRFSKSVLAGIGYGIFAATYAAFSAASSHVLLWTMMACYGLYYALTNPVLRAIVVETVAADSRGRAFGLFYFSTSIATLLASLLTGELWKHFGPALPFRLSAFLALVAALMLFIVSFRKTRN